MIQRGQLPPPENDYQRDFEIQFYVDMDLGALYSPDVNTHTHTHITLTYTHIDTHATLTLTCILLQVPNMPIGQWYRFISSLFVHHGLQHLLGNTLFMWLPSELLERYYGARTLLLLYSASGVVVNITSVVVCNVLNDRTIMYGASGSISG